MKTKKVGNVHFGRLERWGCLLLVVVSVGGAALFALWATCLYRPQALAQVPQAILVTPTSPVLGPTLATSTPGLSPSATLIPSPTGTPSPVPSPMPLPTATATATHTPTPYPTPPAKVFLGPMQHEYQKLNNCGPVALVAAASFFGVQITQFDAAAVVKGGPEDRNVSPQEMVDYLHSLGLGAIYRVNGNPDLMQRLLANQIPVIVHQWLVRPQDGVLVGHYRVLRGYDAAQGHFIANDPYIGPQLSIPVAQFEEWWRPFSRGFIPVYQVEQEGLVAVILGNDWDERDNHRRALEQALMETQTLADGYAFFNLGDEYLALEDTAAAVAAYDQALAFEFPDHFLWYQFGPLEAFNLAGNYQRVLDISGPLLRQAGELEEARLQRGLAYLGLGNAAAARAEIERALAANPRYGRAMVILDSLSGDGS